MNAFIDTCDKCPNLERNCSLLAVKWFTKWYDAVFINSDFVSARSLFLQFSKLSILRSKSWILQRLHFELMFIDTILYYSSKSECLFLIELLSEWYFWAFYQYVLYLPKNCMTIPQFNSSDPRSLKLLNLPLAASTLQYLLTRLKNFGVTFCLKEHPAFIKFHYHDSHFWSLICDNIDLFGSYLLWLRKKLQSRLFQRTNGFVWFRHISFTEREMRKLLQKKKNSCSLFSYWYVMQSLN